MRYHEHDSLLENKQEEELTEEERKAAWEEYETSQRPPPPPPQMNAAMLQQMQAQYSAMIAAQQRLPNMMLPGMSLPSFSNSMQYDGQFINPYARPDYSSFFNSINLPVGRENLERIGQSLNFLPIEGETVHGYRERLIKYIGILKKSKGNEP